MERRQVTEIPPVTAEVTEHQLIDRGCGGCGRHHGEGPSERDRAGAVRSAGRGAGHLPVARAVPVAGPDLHRDGGDVRLRAVPRRAGHDEREDRRPIAPALQVIARTLIASRVAHFDETGFRVAGRLAWVHSASSGKYVLVTVHARRGTQGMDAAGVLPAFGGIACHDAWAPYDSYAGWPGTLFAMLTCCAS